MTPSKTAHDIELITNANRFTIGKALMDRLLNLIHKSEDKDKIKLALNYGHSVTKAGARGAK